LTQSSETSDIDDSGQIVEYRADDLTAAGASNADSVSPLAWTSASTPAPARARWRSRILSFARPRIAVAQKLPFVLRGEAVDLGGPLRYCQQV
jgi:hypothetical protein